MSSLKNPTDISLYYFDMPARAEAIRLALFVGGIEFKDERVNGLQWQAMKSRFGEYAQIPVLVVDGKVISQAVNILLYAGTLTGLVPNDLEGELRMREAILSCEDLLYTFVQTVSITSADERAAARAVLMKEGGKSYYQLKRIESLIGEGEYLVGDSLTVADLEVYTSGCMMRSGFFDGFGSNCLDAFPKLRSFINRLARHPKVAEYYKDQKAAWVVGFRPEEDTA